MEELLTTLMKLTVGTVGLLVESVEQTVVAGAKLVDNMCSQPRPRAKSRRRRPLVVVVNQRGGGAPERAGVCWCCNGTGVFPKTGAPCRRCGGTGVYGRNRRPGNARIATPQLTGP